ncbi:hypothetical protein M409DRAFT_64540 [Zasmidium cellare ATCC 36951]|uniref:Cytochrome P450 n=1 Tax=Zasmidium cellare ATCC 36951 TaxID=1080233 RepID=A0A6A6CT12_ZASCE|nr:uncharacterized protein M409DRAFT_64540 [Zasmidium cellare ATCC 36951]KAF2170205.1 hypothetical protein M409DRAFT_64540 [Zasmidium cellare ATCC 36951]
MDLSKLPATAKVGLGLAAFYLLYRLVASITLWNKRRAMKREKGVMAVPWYQALDPFFGIDVVRGNIKNIREHKMLEKSHERFDIMGVNTFQINILGRHFHVTREPENLKVIQAVDFKKWNLGRRRKTDFAPLLGSGIFTTDGAEWQHSRDMLRPNFVRSQVGDLATFENHIGHLIQAIQPNATVDLSVLFFRLTIDSATEFLFGESTGSLTSSSGEGGFAAAFTASQDFIANATRWGSVAKLVTPGYDKFAKDNKLVHDFVDYFVDKGLAKRSQLLEKSNTERYVFIDELVRQTTDRKRIRDELLNILLAGRDTTASLLTNVWFMLSKNPPIWTKLQADVTRLNGAKPTFEQLKDLKYLKAILNESLRLHPVVPLNSREATEDTTLPVGGGPDGRAPIFIKQGELVSWNVYSMHRRKDFYGPDAEEFRPERWLDDPETGKKGLRPGWEYLPFNGGARICLGQQFALTEASYATVRLCQAFSGIESRDPESQWVEFLTLTSVSLNGAKVALTPREV